LLDNPGFGLLPFFYHKAHKGSHKEHYFKLFGDKKIAQIIGMFGFPEM